MTEKKDFSNLKYFPGVEGNPLDHLLHALEKIDNIPDVLFALMLFGLALLAMCGHWPYALGLFAFFLLDWLLLAQLPKHQKSFGPAKPPVFLLSLLRIPFVILPLPYSLFFQCIGSLLVIYGFWIEPHQLKVTYQKLTSPKISSSKPIRILQLGDLHIERITKREQQLNEKIRELNPDLILFSGDIINLSYLKDTHSWEEAFKILSQWKAPLGSFATTGSPAVDLPEIMPELTRDLPIFWLDNKKVTVNFENTAIDIIGLSCSHRPFIDASNLQLIDGRNQEHFTILVYHSPDIAPDASEMGIDLQLSGHTHGGQVCIPFLGAIITGSLYGKKFESGRRKIEEMTLYVSRGIGMEGGGAPRVRFFCPPEIILWEISAPDNS